MSVRQQEYVGPQQAVLYTDPDHFADELRGTVLSVTPTVPMNITIAPYPYKHAIITLPAEAVILLPFGIANAPTALEDDFAGDEICSIKMEEGVDYLVECKELNSLAEIKLDKIPDYLQAAFVDTVKALIPPTLLATYTGTDAEIVAQYLKEISAK